MSLRPAHAKAEQRVALACSVLLILGASLLVSRSLPAPPLYSEANADSIASDFHGTLIAGDDAGTSTRSLSDYHGRVVLLEYRATWCTPCGIGLRDLQLLHKEFRATDLRVVAVSIDPSSRRAEVQRERVLRQFGFDVLQDSDGHGQRAFRVWGVPMSFLIDRAGRIRYRTFGLQPDGASSYWAWPEARARIHELLREPAP